MTDMSYFTPASGLPDPDYDRQFYKGVLFRRIVAWVVDGLLISVAGLFTIILIGVFTLGLGFLMAPLVFLAFAFGYRTVSLAKWSATPGMRFLGIQYRAHDGDTFDTQTAAIHSGAMLLVTATFVGWLLSAIAILATARGQNLPDLVLGTAIINRPID